jgi:hypothetical protein
VFSKLVERSVISSESVADNIDQIIMSLQFQDVTRQAIDAAMTPLRQIGSYADDMVVRVDSASVTVGRHSDGTYGPVGSVNNGPVSGGAAPSSAAPTGAATVHPLRQPAQAPTPKAAAKGKPEAKSEAHANVVSGQKNDDQSTMEAGEVLVF